MEIKVVQAWSEFRAVQPRGLAVRKGAGPPVDVNGDRALMK